MDPDSKLRLVKLLHTAVWALFAGCILAIPAFTFVGNLRASAILIAIVLVEVTVLAANGMRCPLTDVAARYTTDRRDNFDIYLPLWLATHNKLVFGSLYLGGIAYTLIVWMARRTMD